jgi:6-phosphogluconate dehydrogenase (decarboxylating)
MFHFISTQGTSGGLAGPAAVGTGMNLMFGGTTATFDSTVLESLQFGATHTVTTITHNVDQLHFMDWN